MPLKDNPDLLICFLPMFLPSAPPRGPYVIRNCVQKAGYSCEVIDFNLELHQQSEDSDTLIQNSKIFEYNNSKNWKHFEEFCRNGFDNILVEWCDRILSLNAKHIGLSLFSRHSAFFAIEVINRLRKIDPTTRIVIGGAFAQEIFENPNKFSNYTKEAFDLIIGDAELSIVEYLKENFNYPGINSPSAQLTELDSLPQANYEGVDFAPYDKYYNTKRVFITGSKGCTRNCSFCDVREQWPLYYYRSAESLIKEMADLSKKFDREVFEFTDSLINANLREFRRFCDLAIKYRKTISKDFNWQGQFICRSRESFTGEVYDQMKDSGCFYLTVGVESASENVRKHMKKNFSNDDLYFMLEQLNRVRIPITLLMIVGYVNETEEDFQLTLDFIKHCHQLGYFTNDQEGYRLINRVNWGPTLMVTPLSPLSILPKEEFNIQYDQNGHWFHEKSTRLIRLERLFKALDLMVSLGIDQAKPLFHGRYNQLHDELKMLRRSDSGALK
jgi:radical SAM superfamily enzyme YgiQ (UPF0313 family)